MTGVDAIDRTVVTTTRWIKEVAAQLGTEDLAVAYRCVRVVLQALRDRLGPDVSAHVAAQMPLLVRGVFYEGWHPVNGPTKLTIDEFLDLVEQRALLKGRSEAEEATRAVLAVLWRELGQGTVDHVTAVLPNDYAIVF